MGLNVYRRLLLAESNAASQREQGPEHDENGNEEVLLRVGVERAEEFLRSGICSVALHSSKFGLVPTTSYSQI